MQEELLFLRARAVTNFVMQAASTLEITDGEQRALGKFTPAGISLLLKRCFAQNQAIC